MKNIMKELDLKTLYWRFDVLSAIYEQHAKTKEEKEVLRKRTENIYKIIQVRGIINNFNKKFGGKIYE